MIVKEVLEKTTKFLKDKKFETARLDSEMLIGKALGLSRMDLYIKFEQPLQEVEVERCREFLRRRSQGEPVAYILGQRDFYNLTFKVDSRVLIPRPETESLVETVLEQMKTRSQKNNTENTTKNTTEEQFEVIDLGCGSGCIGLSIAHHQKRATVTLVDASQGAVEVTNINRRELGLEATTEVVHGDVMSLSLSDKKFDFIVANPPYISPEDPEVQAAVKKFEPSSALFANDQGLSDILGWSSRFVGHLKQDGVMIFEIGYQQGLSTKNHFESLKVFEEVQVLKDLSGLDRFVMGKKQRI